VFDIRSVKKIKAHPAVTHSCYFFLFFFFYQLGLVALYPSPSSVFSPYWALYWYRWWIAYSSSFFWVFLWHWLWGLWVEMLSYISFHM